MNSFTPFDVALTENIWINKRKVKLFKIRILRRIISNSLKEYDHHTKSKNMKTQNVNVKVDWITANFISKMIGWVVYGSDYPDVSIKLNY